MKYKIIYLFSLFAIAACTNTKNTPSRGAYFISPESGANYKNDELLVLQIKLTDGQLADSVVYFVDEQRFDAVKDTQQVTLPTSALKLGGRMITARIYHQGEISETNSNVIIKPAAAPQKFSYQVEAVFPHDTSSYTQGLEFHAGVFYESDGEYGSSTLRKVALKTGKILKKVDLSANQFGEGLTVIGDKVIQLTWQEGIGLVYDKNTFELIGQFPYQNSREGWGLCNDGQRIYKSDGSNLIYILNKNTYQEEGFIEVYDNQGPVNQLNELEFIDGKIYANVYQTDKIVIIDPKNGAVSGEIYLAGILPLKDRFSNTDVLNGIAFDPASRHLFVTGKKWDKLFQIKLLNK